MVWDLQKHFNYLTSFHPTIVIYKKAEIYSKSFTEMLDMQIS